MFVNMGVVHALSMIYCIVIKKDELDLYLLTRKIVMNYYYPGKAKKLAE